MRAACTLLHVLSVASLRLHTPDDASELLQQPAKLPVNGDDKNKLSKLDPRIEVGPTWIRHRSFQTVNPAAKVACQSNFAVCIVGQLSRLETRSKMTNLFTFASNMSTYANIHAFVVVDTDTDFYVNPAYFNPKVSTCRQNLHNISDVEAIFGPYYRASSYLRASHPETTVNLKNWKKYATEKDFVDRSKRIESHFRQWTHVSECARLIKESENSLGCKYKGAMKIRDNGIVTKPMDPAVGGKLVVKKCCAFGGVNDRFFIAPRKYLDPVFEGPLKLATDVNQGTTEARKLIEGVINPESFWAKVFKHNNVSVQSSDDYDNIPVVDGRCMDGSETVNGEPEWCLVYSRKDCHPKGNLSYFTCVKNKTKT